MKKLVIIIVLVILVSSIVLADKLMMKVTIDGDIPVDEALKDPMFYHTLGDSLFEMREYDEAIIAYEKSLSIEETELTNHNLGVVYYTTKDYDKAAHYFNKSLSLNQDYELSNYHMGLLRFHQSNYEEAITLFRKTISINPGNYQAHYDLAISLVEKAKVTQDDILIREAYNEFLLSSQNGIPHAASNAEFLLNNFLIQ